LSPDEKRFAGEVFDPKVGTYDLWLLDLSSGILSRMTSAPRICTARRPVAETRS
jgi:hypothetical protein